MSLNILKLFCRCPALWAVLLMLGLAGCQQSPPARETRLSSLVDPLQLSSRLSRPSSRTSDVPGADARMTEARSLEEQGEIESAIALYSQIAEEDSRRADAYHRLAVLHDMKGDFRKSAEFYEAALEQQPDNPELHCDLGYSYYLQRRWQDAERAFRVAILMKPELARTHNNLGLLLAHTGRNDEALEEFGRAGCPQSDAEANLSTALAWARQQRTPSGEHGAALATHSQPRPEGRGNLSDPPSSRMASFGSSPVH